MSNNNQPEKAKWLTKRLVKFVAIVSFAVSVYALGYCIHSYFEHDFLREAAAFSPESKKVELFKKLVRIAWFTTIPAMSVLLIINSLLLWACSQKNFRKSDK